VNECQAAQTRAQFDKAFRHSLVLQVTSSAMMSSWISGGNEDSDMAGDDEQALVTFSHTFVIVVC